MSDFLAIDWDDQHLVGIDAHVASEDVHLRKCFSVDWAAANRPSQDPAAAGMRLREELDRAGIPTAPVLVSVPREEAVVRLLEIPECSDDELPDLVRFQAATRSSVPLDRLLLDFLALPRLADTPGRRVLMVTLGKPAADRIQSVLTAARLQAVGIQLSAVGTAEVISRQSAARSVEPTFATLIVTCAGSRIEITATRQGQILLMHAANLSSHDPPDARITQILAETARSTVALAQAAPGIRLGHGWVFGSSSDVKELPQALKKRFGFDFEVLENPFRTPGIRADFDLGATPNDIAIGPLGLLLGQSGRLVESIDFLHPRRKIVKPDRRRLWQAIGGAAVVLLVVGTFVGVRLRMAQLDRQIAEKSASLQERRDFLKQQAPLIETVKSIDDWSLRDIDWLDHFRQIAQAMGGSDKIWLASFDAKLVSRDNLPGIDGVGHAKSRNDVEELEARLKGLGYRQNPKEIVNDSADPQFPWHFDMSLNLSQPPKPAQKAGEPASPPASSGAKAAEQKPAQSEPSKP